MVLDRSQPSSPAQPAQSETVRNLPAVAGGTIWSAFLPIPAAWPAGASQLAIAIDVCHRSNDVEVRAGRRRAQLS